MLMETISISYLVACSGQCLEWLQRRECIYATAVERAEVKQKDCNRYQSACRAERTFYIFKLVLNGNNDNAISDRRTDGEVKVSRGKSGWKNSCGD
jgi:hypothetical protein